MSLVRSSTIVINGECRLLECKPIKSGKKRNVHRVTVDGELVGTVFRESNCRCKAIGISGRDYGGHNLELLAATMAYGELKND